MVLEFDGDDSSTTTADVSELADYTVKGGGRTALEKCLFPEVGRRRWSLGETYLLFKYPLFTQIQSCSGIKKPSH